MKPAESVSADISTDNLAGVLNHTQRPLQIDRAATPAATVTQRDENEAVFPSHERS